MALEKCLEIDPRNLAYDWMEFYIPAKGTKDSLSGEKKKPETNRGGSVLHILHINESQGGHLEQQLNDKELNHRGTSPKNMGTRGGRPL